MNLVGLYVTARDPVTWATCTGTVLVGERIGRTFKPLVEELQDKVFSRPVPDTLVMSAHFLEPGDVQGIVEGPFSFLGGSWPQVRDCAPIVAANHSIEHTFSREKEMTTAKGLDIDFQCVDHPISNQHYAFYTPLISLTVFGTMGTPDTRCRIRRDFRAGTTSDEFINTLLCLIANWVL
jgi:hypothetical protein